MKSTTTTQSRTKKAILAARVAKSAEQCSTEEECSTAGMTAGQLAFSAGMTLDELDTAVAGLSASALAWSSVVDGYYDARDASRVSADQVALAIEQLGDHAAANTIRLMWDEIQTTRMKMGAA